MKRFLFGALVLLSAALSCASPSQAQTNVCSGGGVQGMVVGGTVADGCPYLKINADGSINTTGEAVPTGAATSANQPTNSAQGATTSGQTGNLGQAAATTAAPTYTTGTTNPLSTDTHGAVRILQMNVDGTAVDTTIPTAIQGNLQGTVTTSQVSVTSSATLLLASNSSRHFAKVCNTSSSVDLYYGFTSGVTTSTGQWFPHLTCAWWDISLPTTAIYAISSGASTTVSTEQF